MSFNDDSVVTRQTVLYTGENWSGSVHLTEDGKTLVGVSHLDVRVWNIDSAPCPAPRCKGGCGRRARTVE